MTSTFISKEFNGATRSAPSNRGGYQRTQGYYNYGTMSSKSNLDTEMCPRMDLNPLQTPNPRNRWIKSESNMGYGRPTIQKRHFGDQEEGTRISFEVTQKQNTITHQRGWRSVEEGAHGWQWQTPRMGDLDTGGVEIDAEDVNYEASRFKNGLAQVPGKLGADLPGSESTLQRNKSKFITTEYYRPQGFGRAGYNRSGLNGISNSLGVLPTNYKKGPPGPA